MTATLLDIRTLYVLSGLMAILIAVAMQAMSWQAPEEKGLRYWAAGLCWVAGGSLLFSLQRIAPDWLAVALAATFILHGFADQFLGAAYLFRRPLSARWRWPFSATLFVFYLYFTLVVPSLAVRTVIFSIAISVSLLGMAVVFWRWADDAMRRTHRMTSLLFFGGALVVFVRAIASWDYLPDDDVMKVPSLTLAPTIVYLMLISIWVAITVPMTVNSRLRRSEKQARFHAETANRAKTQFLSNMSHELRTPMNSVLGYAQLLDLDKRLNDKQREFVREILGAGQHLLELINEILDLSKVESGRIELSWEYVSLTELAEDCRRIVQPMADAKGVTLDFDLPATTQLVADRIRLKQVLLNLLSNAIKYNCNQGRVRCDARTVDTNRLSIRVHDTGIGIPEERMPELFHPFSRLVPETSGIEGTGVGLALVKKLVETMGGQVGAESQVNVGSTFWVELPLDGSIHWQSLTASSASNKPA